MAAQSETYSDKPLRFSIPELNARGRLLRLDAVLNDVLSAHAYPPAVEKILAEALVLTALLGSTLKEREGQLTIQAQTENGPISLLVCDYIDGAVRGYAQFDLTKLVEAPAEPNLFALFGKGYLAVTFDRPLPEADGGGRYQGIVPLEGASLSEAAMQYFDQSEQIPTFICIAIDHVDDRCIAGGILVQHLPEGEQGRERLHVRLDHPDWEHVHVLAQSIRPSELTDPELTLEEIAWRLFHDEHEVRIDAGDAMAKGCRCDPDHIRDVIARFPASERSEMADDAGDIVVNCEFCSRKFPISLASLSN
jgi:molecular chaperone Hsp33